MNTTESGTAIHEKRQRLSVNGFIRRMGNVGFYLLFDGWRRWKWGFDEGSDLVVEVLGTGAWKGDLLREGNSMSSLLQIGHISCVKGKSDALEESRILNLSLSLQLFYCAIGLRDTIMLECSGDTSDRHYGPALLMTPRRIRCPSLSFLIFSSSASLCLLIEDGSEAMASISASERPLTIKGEKIFSRPRTICRSTIWVVTLSMKVFCDS